MEKKEKVEFILEQMRLCLAKKDYIRTSIISKKINTRFFTTNEDVDVCMYQLCVACGCLCYWFQETLSTVQCDVPQQLFIYYSITAGTVKFNTTLCYKLCLGLLHQRYPSTHIQGIFRKNGLKKHGLDKHYFRPRRQLCR